MGEAKKPGPRTPRPLVREERLEVRHALKTIESYTRGFAGLEKFLKESARAVALAELHARDYCEALSSWVRTWYDEGTTREYAVAGLLRFSELFWWCRQGLKDVWKLIEEWEMREPGEHRDPAPPSAVKAAAAAAAAWGWHRVAALVWVMFHGLLRPGEAGDLRCGDFKYVPGEGPDDIGNYVVVIRSPKTARRYAKEQHVILDEPARVAYVRWCLVGRGDDELFYGMSNATLADRLSRILQRLNLADLFTLAGLRTGGATYEWVRRRNFEQLRL